MICIYHNDLDGMCAAAVVNKFYTESCQGPYSFKFIPFDYKDKLVPGLIQSGELVVIVDFSFKPEDMQTILGITKNVIWIDHHKTAQAYDYGVDLPGRRDFSEPGKSGAMCAWEHFFHEIPPPLAVKLVSDFDTWTHAYAPDDIYFKEGMETFPHNPLAQLWSDLLREKSGDKVAVGIIITGKTCVGYREEYCKAMLSKYGYVTVFEGLRCAVLNVYRFGSHTFGKAIDEYDACIAYIHSGDTFTVSMYTERPNVDVSGICKKHGGGGHTKAAGFVCEKLPFEKEQRANVKT